VSFASVDVIKVSAWGRAVGFVARDRVRTTTPSNTTTSGFEVAPTFRRCISLVEPGCLNPAALARHLLRLSGNGRRRSPGQVRQRAGHGVARRSRRERADITALDRLAYASERTMGRSPSPRRRDPLPGDVNMVDVAQLVVAARVLSTAT